jgi:phage shock protein E
MRLRIALWGMFLGALGLFSCVRQSVSSEAAITSGDLESLLARSPRDFTLVDVRTPEEYDEGHIPGAINIPVDKIGATPPAAGKNARIIVYCRSGSRSAQARRILLEKGYVDVVNFGGVGNWKGRLVTGDKPE